MQLKIYQWIYRNSSAQKAAELAYRDETGFPVTFGGISSKIFTASNKYIGEFPILTGIAAATYPEYAFLRPYTSPQGCPDQTLKVNKSFFPDAIMSYSNFIRLTPCSSNMNLDIAYKCEKLPIQRNLYCHQDYLTLANNLRKPGDDGKALVDSHFMGNDHLEFIQSLQTPYIQNYDIWSQILSEKFKDLPELIPVELDSFTASSCTISRRNSNQEFTSTLTTNNELSSRSLDKDSEIFLTDSEIHQFTLVILEANSIGWDSIYKSLKSKKIRISDSKSLSIPARLPSDLYRLLKKSLRSSKRTHCTWAFNNISELIIPVSKEIALLIGLQEILSLRREINSRWSNLVRMIDPDIIANITNSSLLPLPYPFVVPGGRFKEIYYWDTFWSVKGLMLSKKGSLVKGIIKNYMLLIYWFNFVPNGARCYFSTRSQPPVLTEIVWAYCEGLQVLMNSGYSRKEAVGPLVKAQISKEQLYQKSVQAHIQKKNRRYSDTIMNPDDVPKHYFKNGRHEGLEPVNLDLVVEKESDQVAEDLENVEHKILRDEYIISLQEFANEGASLSSLSESLENHWGINSPMIDIALSAAEVYRVGLTTDDAEWLVSSVIPSLEREYNWWMTSRCSIVEIDGEEHFLNHYDTEYPVPRPESYKEDITLASEAGLPFVVGLEPNEQDERVTELFRAISAAAESGWDFSVRWRRETDVAHSIATHDISPADLNAILLRVEIHLTVAMWLQKSRTKYQKYRSTVIKRRDSLMTLFWDSKLYRWLDFDIKNLCKRPSDIVYASDYWPLWSGAYRLQDQVNIIESFINSGLFKIAGVSTSTYKSNEQWDAPNGWAPINDVIIRAFKHMKIPEGNLLSQDIARRWVATVYLGYKKSGCLFEKYDSENLGNRGLGGEYEPQVGFGWTNGSVQELIDSYPRTCTEYITKYLTTGKETPVPKTLSDLHKIRFEECRLKNLKNKPNLS